MIKIQPTDKFNKTLEKIAMQLKCSSDEIDKLKVFCDKKYNNNLPENVISKMKHFENIKLQLHRLSDEIHYLS